MLPVSLIWIGTLQGKLLVRDLTSISNQVQGLLASDAGKLLFYRYVDSNSVEQAYCSQFPPKLILDLLSGMAIGNMLYAEECG